MSYSSRTAGAMPVQCDCDEGSSAHLQSHPFKGFCLNMRDAVTMMVNETTAINHSASPRHVSRAKLIFDENFDENFEENFAAGIN